MTQWYCYSFSLQEFDEYRDADDAVFELHHKELLGSRIALEHAKPNKEKYGGDRRDRYDRYGGGRGGGGGYKFRDKYSCSIKNTDCQFNGSCAETKLKKLQQIYKNIQEMELEDKSGVREHDTSHNWGQSSTF